MGGIYKELGQEIARLAYEIYEKSGRIEGHDFENWLEAEKVVMARYAEQKAQEQAAEPFGAIAPVSAAEVLEEELEAEASAELIEAVPAGETPAEEVEPWPVPEKEKAKKTGAAKGTVKKPAKKAAEAAGAKKEEKSEATAAKPEKKAGGKTKKK